MDKLMTTKVKQEAQSTKSNAVDYLISSGLSQHTNESEKTSLKIYLSEAQEKMVEEYCNTFGISVRTMLNSCIQYIVFLSQKQGVKVKDLKYYPKRLGSHCHELLLNSDTLTKLNNSEMTEFDEAVNYAVAGIKVLYEKNLKIKKRKDSQATT
jgi:hypothetical protein